MHEIPSFRVLCHDNAAVLGSLTVNLILGMIRRTLRAVQVL